jgi:hypothetical protein
LYKQINTGRRLVGDICTVCGISGGVFLWVFGKPKLGLSILLSVMAGAASFPFVVRLSRKLWGTSQVESRPAKASELGIEFRQVLPGKWTLSKTGAKLAIEILEHESIGTRGLIANLHNVRGQEPLENCGLIVTAADDYDPENSWFTQNRSWVPTRVVRPATIRARDHGPNGWLASNRKDRIGVGESAEKGLLPWPSDGGPLMLWRLVLSADAGSTEKWEAVVYLQWRQKSKEFPKIHITDEGFVREYQRKREG